MDDLFDSMQEFDHENVVFCQDASIGLRLVIAIHDTTLGPAGGGRRMWTYGSEQDAIVDALRLARGMTYKYAAAGVNLGGGKCVVIGDPKADKSEALFRAVGRHIDRLGGIYLTGEDVGTTLSDMEYIRMETPYVITLPEWAGGVGPIAPWTARGVLHAMRACVREVYGSDDLGDRSVAVQGLGGVGTQVVQQLVEEDARPVVSDIDDARVREIVDAYGVSAVEPDELAGLEVDVFCPCALGGIIYDRSVPKFRCAIICGSANNQLGAIAHGDQLQERGILYAPDYIANAGGTIVDTDRLRPGGFSRERAMENVRGISDTMTRLIEISRVEGISTARAADVLAERRLEEVRRVKLIRPGSAPGRSESATDAKSAGLRNGGEGVLRNREPESSAEAAACEEGA